MIEIIDGTLTRCQECPNFMPVIDKATFYTYGKPSTTHDRVICAHHYVCNSIEKYLPEDCKYGRE